MKIPERKSIKSAALSQPVAKNAASVNPERNPSVKTTMPKRKTVETSERIARRERRIKMMQERWAIDEIEHNGQNVVVMDNITTPEKITPGCVKLQVGNVIAMAGMEYVVEYVNQSRARVAPLQRIKVTVTDRLKDKTATFDRPGKVENIAPIIQADSVIRTISPDEMSTRREKITTVDSEGNTVMKSKKTKNANKGEKVVKPSIKGLVEFIYERKQKGKTLEQVVEAGQSGAYKGLSACWFKDRWNTVPRSVKAESKAEKKSSKPAAKKSSAKKPAPKTGGIPKRKTPAAESAPTLPPGNTDEQSAA